MSKQPTINTPPKGRTVAVVGDVYRFLATGQDTNGKYALWEAIIPPGGGQPASHRSPVSASSASFHFLWSTYLWHRAIQRSALAGTRTATARKSSSFSRIEKYLK